MIPLPHQSRANKSSWSFSFILLQLFNFSVLTILSWHNTPSVHPVCTLNKEIKSTTKCYLGTTPACYWIAAKSTAFAYCKNNSLMLKAIQFKLRIFNMKTRKVPAATVFFFFMILFNHKRGSLFISLKMNLSLLQSTSTILIYYSGWFEDCQVS